MPLEVERPDQAIATQAEILRTQLLEMQTKGMINTPLYNRGIGRLEGVLWATKHAKSPLSLMFTDPEIKQANDFWGMF